MAIESKGASDALSLHEGEREAIGETDFLIRVLFEKLESFVLVVRGGAEYLKGFGSIEGARAGGGKGVRASAREQSEGFIEDEVAGIALPVPTNERFPGAGRLPVMVVSSEVAGEEGARVDEDHSLFGLFVVKVLIVSFRQVAGGLSFVYGLVLE